MPIYEYGCEACGHEFEHLARSSRRRTDVVCPSCGRRKVARKLSVFSARQGAGTSPALPEGCAGCSHANGPCPMQS